MTIEKLLLTLDSGINYYFYGSTDIEVYAAEKLEDTETMTPDILYVTDAYASKDSPGNVLYASSSDIPIILKQLRCSISRDYQITSELNHLNQKVLNNVSLQHISDTCRALLNTTIFLLDEQFSLLAFSGKNEAKRFLGSIIYVPMTRYLRRLIIMESCSGISFLPRGKVRATSKAYPMFYMKSAKSCQIVKAFHPAVRPYLNVSSI